MNVLDKDIFDDKLTQADLIKLMLHNAQHMATREDVKSDIANLKVELKQVKDELKQDISDVRVELKQDISDVRVELKQVKDELKQDIAKLDSKLDRIQWFIVATIATILLKDKLLAFIQNF